MIFFPLPCIIFAGGRSSRMGKDKSLLPFGGFPTLAEFQYRRLKPYFQSIYLSAKNNKFSFEAPLILDDPKQKTHAPTIGLVQVFEELKTDNVFIISVDTPFVGIEHISRLVEACKGPDYDAIVAHSPKGCHPLCGVYCRSILPALHKAVHEGNHRLSGILEKSKTLAIQFPDDEPFFNINRPDDYTSALKNLA